MRIVIGLLARIGLSAWIGLSALIILALAAVIGAGVVGLRCGLGTRLIARGGLIARGRLVIRLLRGGVALARRLIGALMVLMGRRWLGCIGVGVEFGGAEFGLSRGRGRLQNRLIPPGNGGVSRHLRKNGAYAAAKD